MCSAPVGRAVRPRAEGGKRAARQPRTDQRILASAGGLGHVAHDFQNVLGLRAQARVGDTVRAGPADAHQRLQHSRHEHGRAARHSHVARRASGRRRRRRRALANARLVRRGSGWLRCIGVCAAVLARALRARAAVSALVPAASGALVVFFFLLLLLLGVVVVRAGSEPGAANVGQ